jgi:Tol biopolymer transport system component
MLRMGQAIKASVALLAALSMSAGSALAAFPGRPGPIVYAKTNGGSEGLYLAGREGPRQLTSNGSDGQPSFSPDGRSIVFYSQGNFQSPGESEGVGVYVMRRDGSGRRLVVHGRLLGVEPESGPSFFPSGRRIVFSRANGAGENSHSHIYSVRLDGNGLRQLTHGPHDDVLPVVSPNGRRIAFTSSRGRGGIYSIRPDGSHLRVLIHGPAYGPDYSPNGRRIAFARGGDIFLARANGRRARPVTHCRRRNRSRCSYSQPAFSPNGRRIAVRSDNPTDTGSVIAIIGSRRWIGRSVVSRSVVDRTILSGELGTVVGEPTWGVRPRR